MQTFFEDGIEYVVISDNLIVTKEFYDAQKEVGGTTPFWKDYFK